MENKKISVNKQELEELKKLHKETPDHSTFFFKGHEFLKEYAGYLIQYLEQQFGKEK